MSQDPRGPMSVPSRLFDLELHDARLRQMCINSDGTGEICFSHLVVYLELGENEDTVVNGEHPIEITPVDTEIEDRDYEVWSYEAKFALSGICQVSLIGLLDSSYPVFRGWLRSETDEELTGELVLKKVPARKMDMTFFGTGAKLHIEATSITIFALQPIERIQ